jgi:hypothetical protein
LDSFPEFNWFCIFAIFGAELPPAPLGKNKKSEEDGKPEVMGNSWRSHRLPPPAHQSEVAGVDPSFTSSLQ